MSGFLGNGPLVPVRPGELVMLTPGESIVFAAEGGPHPCDDGCLHAREIGGSALSCAGTCVWDARPTLAAIDGVEPITYVPQAAYFRTPTDEPHGPYV